MILLPKGVTLELEETFLSHYSFMVTLISHYVDQFVSTWHRVPTMNRVIASYSSICITDKKILCRLFLARGKLQKLLVEFVPPKLILQVNYANQRLCFRDAIISTEK